MPNDNVLTDEARELIRAAAYRLDEVGSTYLSTELRALLAIHPGGQADAPHLLNPMAQFPAEGDLKRAASRVDPYQWRDTGALETGDSHD
ncbi:hypothetical protein GT625_13405 [Burkholderia thailandensis]|uniref:hypothetical protein n=1 Tax=Burkholderia thailandensis TaxID=57975 RepID=UPI0013775C14|nr:hypothetical protein [Burkholderia thailandensis]NBJ19722.1 hypothetical protein [Burkholderia thailandensis]